MWAQKARTNWILHIKDERGVLTDKPEELENIFLDSSKGVLVVIVI